MRRASVVQVKVKGFDPVTGEGGSKRQAEQDAAPSCWPLSHQNDRA
jgi:dsRNA-specific ribonuclease